MKFVSTKLKQHVEIWGGSYSKGESEKMEGEGKNLGQNGNKN